MGCNNAASPSRNQYALVSYIPDPLGAFLDTLRIDLVPGCSPHAHVTILPPRPIEGSEEEAGEQLLEAAEGFSGFEVELGDVEVFPVSKVIYIGLRRGEQELREMYRALNRGVVGYREPFPYHPHVTLAQNFPLQDVEHIYETARRKWAAYRRTRIFPVESLDFVKNTFGSCWTDLANISLKKVPVGS
jgi:2'-5' RNA ligase